MTAANLTFLAIGGAGILLLLIAVVLDHVLGLGDVDGPISLPSIGGFVGAFGFGGAIATSILGSTVVAVVVGLVVGVGLAVPAAWATVRLSKAASRMRTDATPTRQDLVGRPGVVVTAIPAQGYGEIRITLGGQPVKLNARAPHPVALGSRVFVVEAPSDTSVIVESTEG
jgi:membrane protein implicated in regulation of membrane protease activity